jgi:hypothetical protein
MHALQPKAWVARDVSAERVLDRLHVGLELRLVPIEDFASSGSPTGALTAHWPTNVDSAGNTITRSSEAEASGRCSSMFLNLRAKNSLNVAYSCGSLLLCSLTVSMISLRFLVACCWGL